MDFLIAGEMVVKLWFYKADCYFDLMSFSCNCHEWPLFLSALFSHKCAFQMNAVLFFFKTKSLFIHTNFHGKYQDK